MGFSFVPSSKKELASLSKSSSPYTFFTMASARARPTRPSTPGMVPCSPEPLVEKPAREWAEGGWGAAAAAAGEGGGEGVVRGGRWGGSGQERAAGV